ncbi:MAG: hypothetical protein Q7S40_05030 [Opitutaceae bacterium]|nr:hypothetical protein [Opitutaceae bacterium]
MKLRIFWAVIAAVTAVAFYFWSRQPAPVPTPKSQRNVERARERGIERPAPAVPFVVAKPPSVELPRVVIPPPTRLAPEMVVPIQDRATIDFSIGAPVVRSGGSDTEVLERALREMEAATKNITFPPPKKESPPAKQ